LLLEKPLDCARGDKTKKASARARPLGNAPLFFNIARFFIESIRAMSAAAFAAITAVEMEFFGKTFVTFGRVIKIFAFDWFIFVILVEHDANL